MKVRFVLVLVGVLLAAAFGPLQSAQARPAAGCKMPYDVYLPLVRNDTMIISRFGSTWATAYEFGVLKGADDYQTQRTPSVGQVGGMAGVYDFWGSTANPIAPQAVNKKFELRPLRTYTAGTGHLYAGGYSNDYGYYLQGIDSDFVGDITAGCTIRFTYSGTVYTVIVTHVFAIGDLSQTYETLFVSGFVPEFAAISVDYEIGSRETYAAVEVALDALRQATLYVGESKLWGLRRDGTHVWAWAKCNRGRWPEDYNTKLHLPVELEFFCREGVWYGETEQTYVVAGGAPTPYTFSVVNNGTLPALVKATLIGYVSNITQPKLENLTNGMEWIFDRAGTSNDVAVGKTLVVDAAQYSVIYDGANDYASLVIPNTQFVWMQLEPGTNSMRLTTTGSTNRELQLTWYDTYLP